MKNKLCPIIVAGLLAIGLCGCENSLQDPDTYSVETEMSDENLIGNFSEAVIEDDTEKNVPTQPYVMIPQGNPSDIEQMLFSYFNEGGELDTEGLKSMTSLRMYGTNLISVVCGDSVGKDQTAITEYDITNKKVTAIYNYDTSAGRSVKVDYPIGTLSDISFLKYCTNLEELEITCNEIVDISPISDLSRLTFLNLSYNRIEDISPIAELSGLLYIHFDGNSISNIACLSGLCNLSGIGMNYNSVFDISPLANLVNLRYINFNYNQISDISSVNGLSKLEDFHIKNNNISEEEIKNFKVAHPKCFVLN